MSDHSHDHDPDQGYDRQEPDPKVIILFAVVLLLFVSVSGFGMRSYFLKFFDAEEHVKIAEAPTTEIDKMRSAADAEMHSYGWVDEKAGIMRLPIERAMEMEVERAHVKSEVPADKSDKKASDKKTADKKPVEDKTVNAKGTTAK